ncbi:hypothetical protein [Campylobacter hyointestinalis]
MHQVNFLIIDIFINRELSWLRFNSHVIAQCKKDSKPDILEF